MISLLLKQRGGAFHIFDNRHAERAALFAGTALDAFACVVRQDGVMLAHGFGDFALRLAQIQEFCY